MTCAGCTLFLPTKKEKRLAELIHEALKTDRAGAYLHFIGGKPYTRNFVLRAAECQQAIIQSSPPVILTCLHFLSQVNLKIFVRTFAL